MIGILYFTDRRDWKDQIAACTQQQPNNKF